MKFRKDCLPFHTVNDYILSHYPSPLLQYIPFTVLEEYTFWAQPYLELGEHIAQGAITLIPVELIAIDFGAGLGIPKKVSQLGCYTLQHWPKLPHPCSTLQLPFCLLKSIYHVIAESDAQDPNDFFVTNGMSIPLTYNPSQGQDCSEACNAHFLCTTS